MPASQHYDVAIAGGGLGGLSLAILLARKGVSVILAEKETYPFHRVCGEYISLESWDFLQSLGLDLQRLDPPKITRLQVSDFRGKILEQELPLGGFGISRYCLDAELATLARNAGCLILDNTQVQEINFDKNEFILDLPGKSIRSKVAVAAFGKRSNLDIRWKRPFLSSNRQRLNNYIGVKYHVRCDLPRDTIALHNFPGGYCGIVKIEDDKFNLCYLTTASNLKKAGGNLRRMEKEILGQNPRLREIWEESEFLYERPLTISQISFDRKSQVEDHILMVGDAAGMIAPLCGNGMSMALHASKLAAESIEGFLADKLTRAEMERDYQHYWKMKFGKRLATGRFIQEAFGRRRMTGFLLSVGRMAPGLVNTLIRQTHGEAF